jgi:hypothetical protein
VWRAERPADRRDRRGAINLRSAGEIIIKPPEVEEVKRKAIDVRRAIDEKILAGLLRLNLQRAGEEEETKSRRDEETE